MEDIAYEHWFGGGHHRLNGRSYLFGAREHHGYRECSREPAVHNQQWNTKLVGQCEWDGYIDVPIVRDKLTISAASFAHPLQTRKGWATRPPFSQVVKYPGLSTLSTYKPTLFRISCRPAAPLVAQRQDALTYVMGLNVHQADEW